MKFTCLKIIITDSGVRTYKHNDDDDDDHDDTRRTSKSSWAK